MSYRTAANFMEAINAPKPAPIKQVGTPAPVGPDPLRVWHAALFGHARPVGSTATEQSAATWSKAMHDTAAADAQDKQRRLQADAEIRADRAQIDAEWAASGR